MALILYKANDQFIELPNLRSALDENDKKTAAIVVATLYDRQNVVVHGVDGITLSHIGAGTYRGRIESDFNPPKGGGYRLVVDAAQSGDDLHVEYVVEVRVNEVR